MPRKNKRKLYTTGKETAFFGGAADSGGKPECAGCAFAGYGGVCKASDGKCLLGTGKPDCGEADNAPS